MFLGASHTDRLLGLVKSPEESQILALIANLQVSFHSLMDAGRKHETPGSETKNFATHSTTSSVSSVSALPPPPHPQPKAHGGNAECAYTVPLHHDG